MSMRFSRSGLCNGIKSHPSTCLNGKFSLTMYSEPYDCLLTYPHINSTGTMESMTHTIYTKKSIKQSIIDPFHLPNLNSHSTARSRTLLQNAMTCQAILLCSAHPLCARLPITSHPSNRRGGGFFFFSFAFLHTHSLEPVTQNFCDPASPALRATQTHTHPRSRIWDLAQPDMSSSA